MNELEGHRGIKSLFSNDRYLISTGEDRKVKVWDSN
jgi:WD40 repeat protein